MLMVTMCCVFATAEAEAGSEVKMPDGVQPLTEFATNQVYSNNTIDYSTVNYYFSPDGRLTGYSKNRKGFATGTWSVSGNRFCMTADWYARSHHSVYRTCNLWYFDGTSFWTKITESTDRKYVGNVYKGNPALSAIGDQVSEVVQKLKARLGHARASSEPHRLTKLSRM
jgi:hypothetical protein